MSKVLLACRRAHGAVAVVGCLFAAVAAFSFHRPALAIPQCLGHRATIIGTTGNDTIRGTPENDVIVGRGGTDHVNARRGSDVVCLGAGGTDNNTETVAGGAGSDRLTGGRGSDTLSGEEGDDVLLGQEGSDSLHSHEGSDRLFGGTDRDFLFGGARDDRINAGSGSDILQGGQGNDVLRGSAGASGGDLVIHDSSGVGVTVHLGEGWASGAGDDTLIGIENAFGTDKRDRLIGDERSNVLQGFFGDDLLKGLNGSDCLNPGGDQNKADGGRGFDFYSTIIYPYLARFDCIRDQNPGSLDPVGMPQDVHVDLEEGIATSEFETSILLDIEGAFGTYGSDELIGDGRNNFLFGGPSNDDLKGRGGNDTLDGAGGADTIDGGANTDRCLNGEVVLNCE